MSIAERIRHAWRRSGYGTVIESQPYFWREYGPMVQQAWHLAGAEPGVPLLLHARDGHTERGQWYGERWAFADFEPREFTSVSVGDRMFAFQDDGTVEEIGREGVGS